MDAVNGIIPIEKYQVQLLVDTETLEPIEGTDSLLQNHAFRDLDRTNDDDDDNDDRLNPRNGWIGAAVDGATNVMMDGYATTSNVEAFTTAWQLTFNTIMPPHYRLPAISAGFVGMETTEHLSYINQQIDDLTAWNDEALEALARTGSDEDLQRAFDLARRSLPNIKRGLMKTVARASDLDLISNVARLQALNQLVSALVAANVTKTALLNTPSANVRSARRAIKATNDNLANVKDIINL